jgi:hypothetical protein
MRGQRYCYSHQRKHEQAARKNAERARQSWFESMRLNDVKSVQRALREVMNRLLSGQVDHKQAGQILYKLQTASVNLRTAASEAECTERKLMPAPKSCRSRNLRLATFASSLSSETQEDFS